MRSTVRIWKETTSDENRERSRHEPGVNLAILGRLPDREIRPRLECRVTL